MGKHHEHYWKGVFGTVCAVVGALMFYTMGPEIAAEIDSPKLNEFMVEARPIFSLFCILIGVAIGEVVGVLIGIGPDKARSKGKKDQHDAELREHYDWVKRYADKRE